MVYYIIKLVLEFQFDLQNPLKQPKMWIFEKWKIIVFGQNYGIFWPKGDLKPCIIMYLGNIHNMSLVPVTFGNFFFSNPPKMALFGLNWEESKWPGHFCSIVLYFFASKIGVKLPPEKKVPWHRRWAALGRGSNCHFFQKNAFFGQKKAFFQKVHFIQKCSVTQNTIFSKFF